MSQAAAWRLIVGGERPAVKLTREWRIDERDVPPLGACDRPGRPLSTGDGVGGPAARFCRRLGGDLIAGEPLLPSIRWPSARILDDAAPP